MRKKTKELIKRAEAGDVDAMMELVEAYQGFSYEYNDLKEDPEKEIYWVEKLAEQTEDLNSMFNIGKAYASGYGVKVDIVKANYWLQKVLVELQDNIDEYGDIERFIKKVELIVNKEEAAKNGDGEAQAVVAEQYMAIAMSMGLEVDGETYQRAFEWAKKAAEQKAPDAFWILALAYEHGRGTKKNIKKSSS
jgi:TPR repeat protein